MNKQEALEALLRKVRGWEEDGREVRLAPASVVADELFGAAGVLDTMRRKPDFASPMAVKEALVAVGAAALYLLANEVTVVEGRTLDEWLASSEDERLAMFAKGEMRVVVETFSDASLEPVGVYPDDSPYVAPGPDGRSTPPSFPQANDTDYEEAIG